VARTTTGAAENLASSKPVRVFVTAGPLPTTTTPGRPAAMACPVAMNTALRWSRHSTVVSLEPSAAVRKPRSSLGRPNTVSTPVVSR
jgi:hypothetical protein